MAVKCGNCKGHHETVADVRSCYENRARAQRMERVAVTPVDSSDWAPGREEWSPTETVIRQGPYSPTAASAGTHDPTLARTEPTYYGKRGEPWPYPPGRYAILVPQDPDSLNHGDRLVTKFYKVDVPGEGKWAGYVFVKVQAGDELYPVKGEAGQVVLRKIAEDPEAAMLLYGREIGKCGHCGRTLTNEESRAVGIGPICRGKVAF